MNQCMNQFVGLMLAQADAAVSPAEIQSVWDFAVKGGFMMVPIAVCSFMALAVFVERSISLRRRRIIPADFLAGLKAVLKGDKRNARQALEYCKKDGSPVANVFAAGIKRMHEPIDVLEQHIQDAGEREVSKMRKYLRLLSVIASIAPLMGLLGTIFGMIEAFQTVAVSGEALGKTEALAGGIYAALITTAAGLLVAIPVLIAYHWISGKIEAVVDEVDHMTVDFVEDFAHPSPLLAKEANTATENTPTPTLEPAATDVPVVPASAVPATN